MTSELQEQRLAVVREHMQSENTHDFDRTIATFARPRYELMATDEVFDGEDEVRDYYTRTRADFPDQRNENSVMRSTSDGVVVEFDLLGTHATLGTSFRSRMIAPVLVRGRRRSHRLRTSSTSTRDSIRRQLLGDSPGADG